MSAKHTSEDKAIESKPKVEEVAIKEIEKVVAPQAKQEVEAKEEEKAAVETAKVLKPTDEMVLVDDKGNESVTTQLFYTKNKDSFDVVGLKPKK